MQELVLGIVKYREKRLVVSCSFWSMTLGKDRQR